MDVRTLCLSVLSFGDASGYEIKKLLKRDFSYFYDASFGSIYPALNRLQDEKFVECKTELQEKRPDRKVYSLTVSGRLALVKALGKSPGPDRMRSEFLVAMYLADLLPAGQLSKMIDRRISENDNHKVRFLEREKSGTAAERFIAGYGIAMCEAASIYLKDNRYLVESEALMGQVGED